MKNRTIAWSQLSAVLLLALLPLGTELLPGRLAQVGAAAWLCPLLAGVGWWPWGCWVSRRCPPGRRDWGQRVTRRWGRRTARVLAGAFLLWGLFLAAAQAERIGSRSVRLPAGGPRPPHRRRPAAGGVDGRRGAARLCPGCEVFLLAVGAGFVVILLFGIFRLDWSLTLLWTREELAQVPAGALSTAGTMAMGGYALFLLGDVRPEAGARMGCSAGWPCCLPCWRGRCSWFWGSWAAPWRPRWTGPSCKWSPAWGLRGLSAAGGAGLRPVGAGDVALLGLLLLCLGRLLAWLLDRPVGKGKSWLLTGRCFSWGCPLRWGPSPGRDLGALWEPGGGGPPGADPAGNGEEKKLEKSEKRVDIPGRAWYSIKAVARQGRKSRKKRRKNFLTKALSCSKIQFTRESGVHLVN